METNFIGAKLAELDLKLRGPGEIYGTKQHGRYKLKVADLSDEVLVRETKNLALYVLDDLGRFPLLKEELTKGTMKQINTKGD